MGPAVLQTMAAPDIAHIVDLAAVVSDGTPVDWDDAAARASDDTERAYVRRLKLVSEIAHFHSLGSASVAASWSGRPPTLDTSPTAWATRLDDEFAAAVPSEWGPLKILEPVARGTFGDVYRAWDTRLDREVALKLLRRRESPTAVESSVIDEGCQGRSKIRPRWRRKTRPPGRWAECLSAVVRTGWSGVWDRPWGGLRRSGNPCAQPAPSWGGGVRAPGRPRGGGPSCCVRGGSCRR